MNETKIELHTAYGSAPLLCYEHEKGGEKNEASRRVEGSLEKTGEQTKGWER